MAVRNGVSWHDAEGALLDAMALMARLPDRERAFLSAGSRSGWPDVVRSVRDGEYPEARGRVGLRRGEVDRLNLLLLGEQAVIRVLEPVADDEWPVGPLVARVLMAKSDDRGGGFRWAVIWAWEAARCKAAGRTLPASHEALRKRYERAVAAVAVRLDKLAARDQALALALGLGMA
jgi:hypothetical protein